MESLYSESSNAIQSLLLSRFRNSKHHLRWIVTLISVAKVLKPSEFEDFPTAASIEEKSAKMSAKSQQSRRV